MLGTSPRALYIEGGVPSPTVVLTAFLVEEFLGLGFVLLFFGDRISNSVCS